MLSAPIISDNYAFRKNAELVSDNTLEVLFFEKDYRCIRNVR